MPKVNVYLTDEEIQFMREYELKPATLFRPVLQAAMRGEGHAVGSQRRVKLTTFRNSRHTRANGFPLEAGERIVSTTVKNGEVTEFVVESPQESAG